MSHPTFHTSWPFGGPLDHAEGVAEGDDAPVYPAGDAASMPLMTGNPEDDDAAVFQSMADQAAANPPLPVAQTEVANPHSSPITPTLLMTETYTADPAWGQPFLIVPADPRRKSLSLTLFSATATDYIRVADDNGKVSTDRGSFRVYSANPYAGPHTGALWGFVPATASGLLVVTIASVTDSVRTS